MKGFYVRERYLVARLFTRHQDKLRPQPFESEADRWLELVTALLMRAGNVLEEEARAAAGMLAALDVLDVAECASLTPEDPRAALIEEVLADHGFTAEDAATGRQALIEIAQSLEQRWGGKVQRFLREWGERLLDEIPTAFDIRALPEDVIRYVFTYWLQSALGLPVLLLDPALYEYARAQGTTVEDLVAAADSLDLDVALLDEAVMLEVANHSDEE